MTQSSTRISVIIPVLNEQEALPHTLDTLLAYPQIFECIVVDGGSTDGTRELVRSTSDPRVRLLQSAPGRGTQMNHGAAAARGELLLFHHADTHLPAAAMAELANIADQPASQSTAQWGGFQHQFSDANWKLKLVSWLHNFRFSRTGVVYGDQSMFARARFFQSMGAFPEVGLEDLAFSDAALLHTDSQRLTSTVVTDSRKFRQIGELRALAHVVAIILRYKFSKSVANERFFEPYR